MKAQVTILPFLYGIKVVALGDGVATVRGPAGNMGILAGEPMQHVSPVKTTEDATVWAASVALPVDPLFDEIITLGSEERGYAMYGMTDAFRLSLAEQRCEP